MERCLCIHGHFYQPPRENPWLEDIELQDSAHPYHDWNERITAECYAPNSASRILDGQGRISDIVSNYSRISFNFGPTLLSWMEKKTPEVYQAILEADRQSMKWRSGHGNALAQAYNHIIMPLANSRDKRTQIRWGLADFRHRFKREAEGMWLPETAVDIETLSLLAEYGMRFTILAPRQASRVRKTGTGKWKDVSNSRIDPTRPYLCRLPGGRTIVLFFYDGPLSQAVAFEHLLRQGEDFAHRLMSGFHDSRQWTQILSISTDGETYGHHQRHGDMALAYALNYIESRGFARLTNYGEYLDTYPPTHEVEIFENSSWSCVHGIERWRSNCGCNSGGYAAWNQEWRKPLREALDWLRDQLALQYENHMKKLFGDPWQLRNDYIDVMYDRSPGSRERFLEGHAAQPLTAGETVLASRLLEMQRHSLLMYTSCGWFFDELSGLETVQILKYAARAMQLCKDALSCALEDLFAVHLSKAQSNMPGIGSGTSVYNRFVRPSVIDLKKVGVHYAVSSIFTEYSESAPVFRYTVTQEAYERFDTGEIRLAIGRIRVSSDITGIQETLSFAVIHFGHHALNCGIRTYLGPDPYAEMSRELLAAFNQGNFADIVRLMDKHFGNNNFSLLDLFLDEQRKILSHVTDRTVAALIDSYSGMYSENKVLMEFLRNAGMPVPKAFRPAAEFTLNNLLQSEFTSNGVNADRVQAIIADIKRWDLPFETIDAEFTIRKKMEGGMARFFNNPDDMEGLQATAKMIELLKLLPISIDFWYIQNIYFSLAKDVYPGKHAASLAGNHEAEAWIGTFRYMGEMLFFNVAALLAQPGGDRQ